MVESSKPPKVVGSPTQTARQTQCESKPPQQWVTHRSPAQLRQQTQPGCSITPFSQSKQHSQHEPQQQLTGDHNSSTRSSQLHIAQITPVMDMANANPSPMGDDPPEAHTCHPTSCLVNRLMDGAAQVTAAATQGHLLNPRWCSPTHSRSHWCLHTQTGHT